MIARTIKYFATTLTVCTIFVILLGPAICTAAEAEKNKTTETTQYQKPAEPVAAIQNQQYYADAPNEYAARRCKLDVYLPQNEKANTAADKTSDKKYPLVIIFHGGGLTRGHRKVMMPLVKAMLACDIAVATVDYRLAPEAKVPDFIEDSAAAISWVLDNAEKIGADTNKIFCCGYSAGGYLAAMIVQDKSYMEKFGQSPGKLAGLIAISGQMVTHNRVRILTGHDPARPLINQYAPLYHANAKSIPTLCIVGDNDNPARLEENLYWMQIRKLAGNNSDQMVIQKGRNHGNIVNRSDDPEDATNKAIVDFIKKTTKASNSDNKNN